MAEGGERAGQCWHPLGVEDLRREAEAARAWTEKWPRCPACGGEVELTAREGRTREIERGIHVAIPSDVRIPTCTECGEETMSLDITEPLDRMLRSSPPVPK